MSWFEFSRAKQTFLMCGGISSMIPGSQSGDGVGAADAMLTVATMTKPTRNTVEIIFCEDDMSEKKEK